jgi:hypothetical protein
MAGVSITRGVLRALTSAAAVVALTVAGVVAGAPEAMAEIPCKAGDSQVVNPTAIKVCSPSGAWVVTPCSSQKPVAHALSATKAKCLPISAT